MHLAHRIGGKGFDDMQQEDVADILTERAVEITNKELDMMAQQGFKDSDDNDDDQQPPTPKTVPLTTAKIERSVPMVPMLERSLKFKRQLNATFFSYAEMLKDLRRRSKQTTTDTVLPASLGEKITHTFNQS
jgi:hypothetical protein